MNITSPAKNEQLYPVLLLAAILLSYFYGIGSVPLFDIDEGSFSEATREMVASGNYITTYLNGDLRFDKPILIYWLQALCVHIFGVTELSFRLPSAIASTLWTLGTYYFTARFYERKTAFTAAFVMATTITITFVGKLAIADALLNLFVAYAMFVMYAYYESRSRKYIYLAHLFIALGVLTKGPVAILIPFCVSFIFFGIKKRLGDWAKAVFSPIGIIIFLAVAAPWYVAEYMEQGQAFIDGFLFKHNMQRFSGSLENHSGSIFYYVPVVLIGLMPYTGPFITVLFRFKKYIQESIFLYLLIWFGFVFIFFSLSGTKLPHYMTYGYTPLFILIAEEMDTIKNYRIHIIPILVFTAFFLYLPNLLEYAIPKIKDDYFTIIAKSLLEHMNQSYMLSIAVCLVILSVIIMSNMNRYKMLTAIGFVTLFLVNVIVTPIVGNVLQQPVKDIALLAKEKGYDVNILSGRHPSFLVYYENKIEKHAPRPGDYLFIRENKLEKISFPYDIIYEKRGYKLIKIWEKQK